MFSPMYLPFINPVCELCTKLEITPLIAVGYGSDSNLVIDV